MANLTSQGRRKAADAGHAMGDGSFPIESKDDVQNAVQAYGRTNNRRKPAVKRHIIKRAKALGAVGSLPKHWVAASVQVNDTDTDGD